MQFKYAEVLWALFLLVIPLLIHLFKLRRYRAVRFTNVAFLQTIVQKNRKSSQLKRLIVLFLRMLALTTIIIAFAQPLPEGFTIKKETEIVIYIDNSFSMQTASSDNGSSLLRQVVSELLIAMPETTTFSLFTNRRTYRQITKNQITNSLLSLSYTPHSLTSETIIAQGSDLFSDKTDTYKSLILISDFKNFEAFPEVDSSIHITAIQPQITHSNNTAITKILLKQTQADDHRLEIHLQSDLRETTSPVAIYNDTLLVAKAQASFSNHKAIVDFSIGGTPFPKGRVLIRDESLEYDNTMYFSIFHPRPIRVMSINESENRFLRRIFNGKDFEYYSSYVDAINYVDILKQDFLVLYELSTIPDALQNVIEDFMDKGGHLAVIPSPNIQLISYNQLLKSKATIKKRVDDLQQITDISFSHPLYKGVFTQRVTNFKYPKTQSYYPIESNRLSPALRLSNQQAFLLSDDVLHLFASSLSEKNSDFQNSSLIVPTFYNMAKHSFQFPPLYYTIGQPNQFDVPINLPKGQNINLVNADSHFVPIQQRSTDKLRISTHANPNIAGQYEIQHSGQSLMTVSYNHDRGESFGSPLHININTMDYSNSIQSAFEKIKNRQEGSALWRWFVTFALIFILLEILVLKYIR